MNGLGPQYRIARRIVVAVIGGTLVLLGIVMLVTPGPGILTILAGLGILALEFYWARHWLAHLRRQMQRIGARPGR
ncbi:MAG TPA: PGPGW domain-containing protein [Mariprofundaceae bacterium]|nr:PGPGW domain-containing protein [Mariprofundaceae bacterium]